MKSLLRAFWLGLGVSAIAGTAMAGGFTSDNLTNCFTLNCVSRGIAGSYTSTGTGTSKGNTWVHQTFCKAGECCRFEVTSASADLEMAVVSPDPAAGSSVSQIWADDDSGVGFRPLIVIDPVPRTGRYTVVLSRFSSSGTGTTNFTLKYGRYPSGNSPNCTNPSTPGAAQFGAEEEFKPAE